MARLSIAGVSRRYESRECGVIAALEDVSLEIGDGELLAVLGPSGCGKTTLLRLIAGFEAVSAGQISIGGQLMSGPDTHVAPELRRVGIVFQSYALWPHMTVAENVGYPLRVAKVAMAERARRIEEALALVDLAGFGERQPAMLSGGQRQRVALARCLVMTPSLVLLDEPLANLDVHLRASMEAEFAGFHAKTGTTMVYITHDQGEAMALADRIAVLDQGRLLQVAAPSKLYREPADEAVARFIGDGMLLPARILAAAGGGRVEVEVCGQRMAARAGAGEIRRGAVRVCVHPPGLRLAAAGDAAIEASVTRVVYQGGRFRVQARTAAVPGEVLRFDAAEPSQLATGDAIRLAISDAWVLPG